MKCGICGAAAALGNGGAAGIGAGGFKDEIAEAIDGDPSWVGFGCCGAAEGNGAAGLGCCAAGGDGCDGIFGVGGDGLGDAFDFPNPNMYRSGCWP